MRDFLSQLLLQRERGYRERIDSFATWCNCNHLKLDISKTNGHSVNCCPCYIIRLVDVKIERRNEHLSHISCAFITNKADSERAWRSHTQLEPSHTSFNWLQRSRPIDWNPIYYCICDHKVTVYWFMPHLHRVVMPRWSWTLLFTISSFCPIRHLKCYDIQQSRTPFMWRFIFLLSAGGKAQVLMITMISYIPFR